jgi:GTP-binding protein
MVSFVDQVTLHLRAGNGGKGCVSVKREKFKPLAGPDGADGGNGGTISLFADSNTTTLLEYHFHPHRAGGDGAAGAGDFRNGAQGGDLKLPVPIGTIVKTSTGELIADLDEVGMELVVAQGGVGGLGNAALASAKRKAPGFALLGVPGWSGDVILELKTVADIALVGYPSAGKSSLIAAVSAARPKIADYPFTTLHPNLGVVQAGETRFTIADVPGLIEGASEGKGLGLEFLRHVERCSALLHVIDCGTIEPNRDPSSDLDKVLKELAAYKVPEGQLPLTKRPALIALNKVDLPDAKELAEFIRGELEERGYEVFEVSAATHAGLKELKYAMAKLVEADRYQKAQIPSRPKITLMQSKKEDSSFKIIKEFSGVEEFFRILGSKPQRWVAQTEFGNDEAVGYLAERIAKIGIEDALFKAGASSGSTVVIGPGDGIVFDWEPTIASTAELLVSPRGTDPRFGPLNDRRTTVERRKRYQEMMDARSVFRDQMEEDRKSGAWTVPTEPTDSATNGEKK